MPTYSFNGIGLGRNLIYASLTFTISLVAEEAIAYSGDYFSALCATVGIFQQSFSSWEEHFMAEMMTGSVQHAGTYLPVRPPGGSLTIAFQKFGRFSAHVRNRAWRLKNEQPLQVLAILAAVAATAGAATRVWRSNQDE